MCFDFVKWFVWQTGRVRKCWVKESRGVGLIKSVAMLFTHLQLRKHTFSCRNIHIICIHACVWEFVMVFTTSFSVFCFSVLFSIKPKVSVPHKLSLSLFLTLSLYVFSPSITTHQPDSLIKVKPVERPESEWPQFNSLLFHRLTTSRFIIPAPRR